MNFLKKLVSLERAILIVVVLVALFYFILAWFNTFSRDDNHFLYLINNFGFFGAIKFYYLSWQGRVSAYVFTNLTLLAQRYTNGLFIWFCFLVVLFGGSIYFLFVNTFNRLKLNFNKDDMLLFSVYLFVFFQEIVYDKSTIFWLAASTSYYAGLAFLIAGVALILHQGKGLFKLISVFIMFLIVGCSLEHLAIISVFILAAFLLSTYLVKTKKFFYRDKPEIIVGIIALCMGIAIMMLCPGLEHRRAAFPKPDLLAAIKISANSFYHFYKFMLLPDLGRIMLFSAPFIYMGHKFKPSDSSSVESNLLFRTVILILLVLVAVISLTFLIMAKGTGGMGQPRTLFHIAFFIALSFSAIGFISGYTSQISKPVAMLLSYAALFVFMISLAQNYIRVLPESVKYAKSEKKRIDFLMEEKTKGRTESIVLDSLHYNQYVIYRTDEISPDTAGEWNKTLMRGLGIEFNISSNTVNYTED
ncbi:MAG: hypothetical protein AB7G44_13065 [Bacteroidia bacterium]